MSKPSLLHMNLRSAALFSILVVPAFQSCEKNDISQSLTTNTGEPVLPCLDSRLSKGVLAYYPFRLGSLKDESGNGHDLVNGTSAAPAADRQGNQSCAFGFYNMVRRNEMLSLPQTAFLDSKPAFSVSLWYYAEDTSRDLRVYETLISQDTGFDCPNRMGNWSLGLYDGRVPVFAMYHSVWDISRGSAKAPYPWVTNKWRHVVVTYDRNANHEMKIFIDGAFQSAVDGLDNCKPKPVIFRGGTLLIGHLFNGRIDDVIIYDRVLPSNEIRELYSFEPCCANASE